LKEGKKVDPEDTMIAAIAIKNGETVLTGEQQFKRINKIKHPKTEAYRTGVLKTGSDS